MGIIDELIEAASVKEENGDNYQPQYNGNTPKQPRTTTAQKQPTRQGKRPSKVLHDFTRWKQHQHVVSAFTVRNDLDQVTSPVNSWKDDERDETVYLPHNIAQLGPISELLATGEVLFQSRSYVNPLISKAIRGE